MLAKLIHKTADFIITAILVTFSVALALAVIFGCMWAFVICLQN